VIVHIPSPLQSYTEHETPVTVRGKTLIAVLRALDSKYEGFLFRILDEQGSIREHIRLFVGTTPTDNLESSLDDVSEVHIICALSGG
jgi:sulfur-carrier protein